MNGIRSSHLFCGLLCKGQEDSKINIIFLQMKVLTSCTHPSTTRVLSTLVVMLCTVPFITIIIIILLQRGRAMGEKLLREARATTGSFFRDSKAEEGWRSSIVCPLLTAWNPRHVSHCSWAGDGTVRSRLCPSLQVLAAADHKNTQESLPPASNTVCAITLWKISLRNTKIALHIQSRSILLLRRIGFEKKKLKRMTRLEQAQK